MNNKEKLAFAEKFMDTLNYEYGAYIDSYTDDEDNSIGVFDQEEIIGNFIGAVQKRVDKIIAKCQEDTKEVTE